MLSVRNRSLDARTRAQKTRSCGRRAKICSMMQVLYIVRIRCRSQRTGVKAHSFASDTVQYIRPAMDSARPFSWVRYARSVASGAGRSGSFEGSRQKTLVCKQRASHSLHRRCSKPQKDSLPRATPPDLLLSLLAVRTTSYMTSIGSLQGSNTVRLDRIFTCTCRTDTSSSCAPIFEHCRPEPGFRSWHEVIY